MSAKQPIIFSKPHQDVQFGANKQPVQIPYSPLARTIAETVDLLFNPQAVQGLTQDMIAQFDNTCFDQLRTFFENLKSLTGLMQQNVDSHKNANLQAPQHNLQIKKRIP